MTKKTGAYQRGKKGTVSRGSHQSGIISAPAKKTQNVFKVKHAHASTKNHREQTRVITQCGARTHDHKIKSLALCRLS